MVAVPEHRDRLEASAEHRRDVRETERHGRELDALMRERVTAAPHVRARRTPVVEH
jgi:hypothetical protein